VNGVYLIALGVTLATETLGAVALALAARRSPWRWAVACVAVNLASHPLFWLGLPLLPLSPRPRMALAEGLVVVAEGLAYRRALGLPAAKALGLSLLLNAASFVAGSLAWRLL
jgi:bacteriorhodopsin